MLIEKLFHSKLSQIVNSNVDYKKGINNFAQVNLLNVKLGEGETIPATQLINHIFDSNDKKVQTLYFTFHVKNYDADDNKAFINTQEILNAASINDASINQSIFSNVGIIEHMKKMYQMNQM